MFLTINRWKGGSHAALEALGLSLLGRAEAANGEGPLGATLEALKEP